MSRFENIPSPKEFFGFVPGDDFCMIHWNKLCEYYFLLAERSDRIIVEEVGKTSEGNPFLMIYVSEAENLRNLERYRQISVKMADPRGLSEDEIDKLATEGKAVVMASYGLHSNEVGGPQMVPTMLYDLITAESGKLQRILDNVIFIVSPCSEPDGEIVFTEWYYKHLGTRFEGIPSPYIRHNWAGHSNNRDAVRESVVESKYLNDVLIRNWKPQVFSDHHHQCPHEPRMSIPPMSDPIYEPTSPLAIREQAAYSAAMAEELTIAGRRGVIFNEDRYTFSPSTCFYNNAMMHNAVGLLTESADAHIATPAYVHKDQVIGTMKQSGAQCPDVWEGGEWHLSDIVEQMYIASVAILDFAAKDSAHVLKNMARKALAQTERGANSEEGAYLISPYQHDASALDLFLKILRRQCIEFYATDREAIIGGKMYPKGTVVVPLDQPNYASVMLTCSVKPYPTNPKAPDISKICGGDKANLSTALCMGIETVPAMDKIDRSILTSYEFKECQTTLPLSAKENISYRTANRLMSEGVSLSRDAAGNFCSRDTENATPIRRAKVGLLKKSQTSNQEEAFARNLLRRFDFDYRLLMDSELRLNGTPDDLDVIIIPGDTPDQLTSGDVAPPNFPPEYQSGLGAGGAEALRQFVSRGGRLVAWDKSCMYVSGVFGMRLRDLSQGKSPAEYITAGSALRGICTDDELTLGMPRTFSMTHNNGPILLPNDFVGKLQAVARFDTQDNVFINGLMRGEALIAETPCILRYRYGDGEVIMYTFTPSFHVQNDATFKLLFNALYRKDNT